MLIFPSYSKAGSVSVFSHGFGWHLVWYRYSDFLYLTPLGRATKLRAARAPVFRPHHSCLQSITPGHPAQTAHRSDVMTPSELRGACCRASYFVSALPDIQRAQERFTPTPRATGERRNRAVATAEMPDSCAGGDTAVGEIVVQEERRGGCYRYRLTGL